MTDPHPDTAAVHAGRLTIPVNRASSPPLFQASSYEFDDLAEAEEIYAGTREGRIYGRYGGPNAAQFEDAIASLEGAEAAVGTASGMAAIDAALAAATLGGGSIVSGVELYGGTHDLLENDYRRRGVDVTYVDQHDHEAVRAALARACGPSGKPAALYVEALTNPLMRVAELGTLAALAREFGALSIVDATFATPALVRPIDFGFDLVLHSVGKYLGGHGDVGAGVFAGRSDLIAAARKLLVRRGATLPHFEAWLALRGVRTLGLRMARHSSNANALAAFLATRPEVERVHHPSLASHEHHERAKRLYPRGTGGIVAFDLAGGATAVDAFVRGLQTVAIVYSLGEVATTISYPFAGSHRTVAPDVRAAQGVRAGTLRISAGIEDPTDIIADLTRAFAGLPERVRA
jgi:methionine-gamma-lyase